MTQTTGRFFDELGKLITDAAGAAQGVRKEIASMPGNFQLSIDTLVEEVGGALDRGICAFILFGIPAHKDSLGSSALDDEGDPHPRASR